MFSIHCNSRTKLAKNKKRCTKNKKNTPFINKYNWKGINYPSEKDDWNKFEKNITIALNVLYDKKEKIYPAHVSKHNSNHDKQVILLMISNGEKGRWHCLAVKKLSALLGEITPKH